MIKSLRELVEEFSLLNNKKTIVNRICALASAELVNEFGTPALAAVIDDIQKLGESYAEELKNIESLEFVVGDEPADGEEEDGRADE